MSQKSPKQKNAPGKFYLVAHQLQTEAWFAPGSLGKASSTPPLACAVICDIPTSTSWRKIPLILFACPPLQDS